MGNFFFFFFGMKYEVSRGRMRVVFLEKSFHFFLFFFFWGNFYAESKVTVPRIMGTRYQSDKFYFRPFAEKNGANNSEMYPKN